MVASPTGALCPSPSPATPVKSATSVVSVWAVAAWKSPLNCTRRDRQIQLWTKKWHCLVLSITLNSVMVEGKKVSFTVQGKAKIENP
ncbi:hypothetical protein FKM82_001729 [Ascaphus truei]